MNNIIKLIGSIIIVGTLITSNVFSQERSVIAGKDRFETAIEISKSWRTSQNAILVNSISTSDLLCATVLSSQMDCPILLTNKNYTNKETIKEMKRLNINKIYLIGGEEVIHETIEEELKNNNIAVERIYGKDRYETSIKVADKVNELRKIDSVILVNGEHGISNAVSISPVAGNKNIPIILYNDKDSNNQVQWINENDIKSSYIIGEEKTTYENIEEELNNIDIKIDKIYGKDKYETNVKVIENFYTGSKINKVFYCKGKSTNKEDEIIDGMLISPIASKEKAPIILLGERLSKEQTNIIKKKEIKNLVQVGFGVSEESKNQLYKLKESYVTQTVPNQSTSKPNISLKPIQPEEILPEKNPNKPSEEGKLPEIDEEIPSKPEEELPEIELPNDTEENPPEKPIEPEIKPPQPEENLKYEGYTIKDNKIITINFNQNIETLVESIEELKKNINILIDKDNIINIDNSDTGKYIKLNKYDNIKVNENSLIIELDDEILINSTIVINPNIIKDSKGKNSENIEVNIEEGIVKKIAFVSNQKQLEECINNTTVNIIKLEKDIAKETDTKIPIRLNNNIIIDGSNGENNFKIYEKLTSLSQINMISDDITLKNLDLDGIYINIMDKRNILLKNMKIDLNNRKITSATQFTPCVTVNFSTVEAKDLTLINNDVAIEVRSINSTKKRSKLIIDGYVYNEKRDDNKNYNVSIKVENKTTDTSNLNEVILKDENNDINDMFNKININDNSKIYELYYKK